MSVARRVVFSAVLLVVAIAPPAALAHARGAHHSLRAAVTDQNFYFVMADRFQNGSAANDNGGLPPGKAEGQSGFDPTGKGWYHGGDLAGLRSRLGYIKRLGTTAIWLTPSFKNKAVQDNNGFPSAGYHGYWITDFTQIDPHLGTNDDLKALIRDAHGLGMKVYFDIISNHTADVIRYQEGAAPVYKSKDEAPYKTASGTPFDDRDYAGGSTFPALAPSGQPSCDSPGAAISFPYRPCVPAAERDVKVPAWLNDVSLYHNRGNTTFAGENSQYGDFFGLDDLFTENPRVVNGMIDIYKTWIRDFRIDGFRMDTMKHVNDEFWQKFAPAMERYARSQGVRDFYMFGEVAEDTSRPITSHYMTHDDVQGVLDFPFQTAATRFAANSAPTAELGDFFRDDDWYTDGDSNVYNLPTFLGNHDKGRIGMFIRNANPDASQAELLQRDRLAHALMYFSRGNPVVYYGDEQGFTGNGGDQDARQDMFPSQSPQYNNESDADVTGDDGAGKNDDIGSDATPMDDNFDPSHPLYRELRRLAKVTRRHPALRDGAQQDRFSSSGPGVYAFSRIDRSRRREYVVALNNAEQPASASIPTYARRGGWEKVYGAGSGRLRSGRGRHLDVTVAPLSAVVYRAKQRIPRSRRAPSIALDVPAEGRDRLEVRADLGADKFSEVTFFAKSGRGGWRDIGTDDNAPYRVLHDVSDIAPGTRVKYRAVVLDNAHHARTSRARSSTIAAPAIALEAPAQDTGVRGTVEVRASATPEHADHVVTFQRSVDGGAFTDIGTDDSSPVYTVFDDTSSLPDGARVSYRAVLTYASGRTVTSDTRTVTIVQARVTTAIVHYQRPGGDYDDWGLHLWGDAIADSVTASVAWDKPFQRTGTDAFGAVYEIPLKDDTKAVNFIMHRPSGDSVPATREPGGDRSFVPLAHPEIWLVAGDATVYFSPPPG
jgi:alpha-amylase